MLQEESSQKIMGGEGRNRHAQKVIRSRLWQQFGLSSLLYPGSDPRKPRSCPIPECQLLPCFITL